MTLAETDATVYQSALTEDCIEKGKSKEKGGARYNFGPGITACGAVDVGDSLAAIKKLVYEEEKITMQQLCDALDANFEGYGELHRMLLKAPKYGNDDDYADQQVAWVMRVYSDEVLKQKNRRGGHMLSKQIPLSTFMPQGKVVGALPSGRVAGEPLSDGVSPTRGSDIKGPTAVIKSVGKINAAEVSRLGQTLNMRLSPAVFEDTDGFKRLAGLLRVFIDEKIHHIQLNVVSSDAMRAAQAEPEKYNDLVVKVAGYNAYFTTLPKSLQDAIIARTEHGL
jgi:formate C-acetyltransferase